MYLKYITFFLESQLVNIKNLIYNYLHEINTERKN